MRELPHKELDLPARRRAAGPQQVPVHGAMQPKPAMSFAPVPGPSHSTIAHWAAPAPARAAFSVAYWVLYACVLAAANSEALAHSGPQASSIPATQPSSPTRRRPQRCLPKQTPLLPPRLPRAPFRSLGSRRRADSTTALADRAKQPARGPCSGRRNCGPRQENLPARSASPSMRASSRLAPASKQPRHSGLGSRELQDSRPAAKAARPMPGQLRTPTG